MVIDTDDGTAPFPNIWQLTPPVGAVVDQFIGLRARLSNQDNMTPYGKVATGEVEDYLIQLNTVCEPHCLPVTVTIKRGE